MFEEPSLYITIDHTKSFTYPNTSSNMSISSSESRFSYNSNRFSYVYNYLFQNSNLITSMIEVFDIKCQYYSYFS
jgi:hypothetical protein